MEKTIEEVKAELAAVQEQLAALREMHNEDLRVVFEEHDKDCKDYEAQLAKAEEDRREDVRKCEAMIPTNWLDPLLTGPDAVIKQQITNPQIQMLLTQLCKRIRNAFPEVFP